MMINDYDNISFLPFPFYSFLLTVFFFYWKRWICMWDVGKIFHINAFSVYLQQHILMGFYNKIFISEIPKGFVFGVCYFIKYVEHQHISIYVYIFIHKWRREIITKCVISSRTTIENFQFYCHLIWLIIHDWITISSDFISLFFFLYLGGEIPTKGKACPRVENFRQ